MVRHSAGHAWERGKSVGSGDGEPGSDDPERSPDPGGEEDRGRGPGPNGTTTGRDVRRARTAVDPAGDAAEGADPDRAVHGPKRALVLRTAALRLPVPMVSGPARCNECLRRNDVLEESGAAAGSKDLRGVLQRSGRGGTAATAALGRTLHRGRHVDRSQRIAQELSKERRRQAAGGQWEQCRGELPRREAEERHARVDEPIPSRSCTARATDNRRSSATSGTC